MKNEEVKRQNKNFIKSYIFDGIILAALGIAMLVWPEWSLKVLCVVLGAVISTMGFIRFAFFLIKKDEYKRGSDLLLGAIMICVGISLILASDFFISLFFIVTGIILVYGAILMIFRAIMLRGSGSVMLIVSIVFAVLVLGLAVLIFINPVQFADFITRIQGAALVIEGIGMIVVLRDIKLTLKDTKEDIERRIDTTE